VRRGCPKGSLKLPLIEFLLIIPAAIEQELGPRGALEPFKAVRSDDSLCISRIKEAFQLGSNRFGGDADAYHSAACSDLEGRVTKTIVRNGS
jgi:hypothetical protein